MDHLTSFDYNLNSKSINAFIRRRSINNTFTEAAIPQDLDLLRRLFKQSPIRTSIIKQAKWQLITE